MTLQSALAALRRPLFIVTIILALAAALLVVAPLSTAQEPVLPTAPPDGATGLDLFGERCANCHGPAGAGDGELAGSLPAPPRPFDANYVLTAQPSAMFNQITNGNLNVGMPPFGPASQNPVSEPNRWDLVAAVFSLSTPPEAVARGEEVYAAECAACHGDSGLGDGPEAAGADPAPTDLTDLSYWFNRSNATVIAALAPGEIAAHAYEISDADLSAAVDYARTFSYAYTDPAELNAPIAAGVISGLVTNGSTDEILSGTTVFLRAFTPEFVETLSMTTTTGIDGSYRFEVADVPQNLVYIAGARYGDLSFSSAADQMSRSRTELDLPVTVFEQSSDATAVNIAQLHLVLEFTEDRLQVNELYVINNNQDAVFVGESGDPSQGTFEVALPAGVENLMFERSFGSMESFVPANDFVQTELGWADPLPLRPGDGALTLLVRYDLPYEDGLTLAHPLFYDAASAAVILPDAGVEVSGDGWIAGEPQQMGQAGSFLNYSRTGMAAGEALTVELDGRPRQVATATGGATVNRNQTTELIIGAAALLVVAGGGAWAYRSWQQRSAGPATVVTETPAAPPPPAADEVGTLLQAIADLDNAYEAGQIPEADYQAQRADLKQRVAALWQ